jgi:predicted ATPase
MDAIPRSNRTRSDDGKRTLEALNLQMEILSRSHPVLMIVEDVHWSDPTSLEAFGRAVDRIRPTQRTMGTAAGSRGCPPISLILGSKSPTDFAQRSFAG